jgi:hypothetical protein
MNGFPPTVRGPRPHGCCVARNRVASGLRKGGSTAQGNGMRADRPIVRDRTTRDRTAKQLRLRRRNTGKSSSGIGMDGATGADGRVFATETVSVRSPTRGNSLRRPGKSPTRTALAADCAERVLELRRLAVRRGSRACPAHVARLFRRPVPTGRRSRTRRRLKIDTRRAPPGVGQSSPPTTR